MPPTDATFHRPSQPAYAVQIVQNADVSNPTAPSCRAYYVEHGSILGSRSAGMSLPRTQVYAVKRIGVICWQFLSVVYRASWVVIEEDLFADASCLIQCVLLFGFCLCFFVVNNPTITQGGRKTQHANLSQRSIKKELPLPNPIQTHTRAGQTKTKTTEETLIQRQQLFRHCHQREPFVQQFQCIFDQRGTDPSISESLENIQGANLPFRRISLENAKPRQLTVYAG